MMRRRHKKSRKGCLECKRRHIKCDETRPRCINCATAERECPYPIADEGVGTSPVEGVSPAASGSASGSGSGHAPGFVPNPEGLPELTPFAPAEDVGPMVNMVHAELLYHFLTDPNMIYPVATVIARDIVMQQALREPYLLHQILALSARHLSISRPESGLFYYNQAVELQTHALTLFNSFDPSYFDISVAHRVPAFIFSAVLGVHALCDMLSHREADFSSTLSRYIGYLHVHRGIYQMMEGYWELIKDGELKPIFDTGTRWYETTGKGHDCDDIRERIELVGFDQETLEAARKAIDLLQCVFDDRPAPSNRTQLLVSWAVMVPKQFVKLIEAGRPEAIVILAYYFVALHHGRDVWMIRDAGHFFFSTAADYLGPQWSTWLEKPRQMMNDFLEEDVLGRYLHDAQPCDAVRLHLTTCLQKLKIAMARGFTISRPTAADAARIAEIHLAAMDSNPLLHVQFPTPESLASLQEFLTRYTAGQLANPTSGVLVARDAVTDEVISFAKWDPPSHPEDVKLESGDLQYSEGCCREFLDGYVALAEEAKKRSFGDKPCYRLSFVCTDPVYQGQGAGSLLTRAVLDQADADRLPAYLESTENAVSMYEKFGFKAIDSFEMEIPAKSGSEMPSLSYRELCMVRDPCPLVAG